VIKNPDEYLEYNKDQFSFTKFHAKSDESLVDVLLLTEHITVTESCDLTDGLNVFLKIK
jgi:hypothetical protein